MVSNRLIGLSYRGGALDGFDFSTPGGRGRAIDYILNTFDEEFAKYNNNPPKEYLTLREKVLKEDDANFRNNTGNRKAFDEALAYILTHEPPRSARPQDLASLALYTASLIGTRNKEEKKMINESKNLYKEALKRQQTRVKPKLPVKKVDAQAIFLKHIAKVNERKKSHVFIKTAKINILKQELEEKLSMFDNIKEELNTIKKEIDKKKKDIEGKKKKLKEAYKKKIDELK